MSFTVTLTLPQGTTRSIVISDITTPGPNPDSPRVPLDVTGWTVRAVARDSAIRDTVLAEWTSGTPTGTQGQAVAVGDEARLTVTPDMSRRWIWTHAILHAHLTEPVAPFREERIGGDVQLVNDFTTVH